MIWASADKARLQLWCLISLSSPGLRNYSPNQELSLSLSFFLMCTHGLFLNMPILPIFKLLLTQRFSLSIGFFRTRLPLVTQPSLPMFSWGIPIWIRVLTSSADHRQQLHLWSPCQPLPHTVRCQEKGKWLIFIQGGWRVRKTQSQDTSSVSQPEPRTQT